MDNFGKNTAFCLNKRSSTSELDKFQKKVEKKHNLQFQDYWEMHKWSVENYATFLEELWSFFEVKASQHYKKAIVKTGPGFLDNEWFSGARLNYAENMLRIRNDRPALICVDELGNEEIVTYAELYEEVKLYAAAFRKNGLKTGDRVACYMSNRKEAAFAMFAAASIGAIFGGPLPFYGAKASSNIVSHMEPKFLITVDEHQEFGCIYPLLEFLPEIVKNAPTLEKVILVATKEDTRKKDFSNIKNCVFLEDFLKDGRRSDGKVPDIIFEQLPFTHPRSISFTSGTTGNPKAVLHAAGCFLSLLQDAVFMFNLKKGDVIITYFPVGWSVWDYFIPCVSLGITIVLFSGCALYTGNGFNFWDIIAKYKVKFLPVAASVVDRMEKMNIVPSPGTDMSSLEIVLLSASPVKKNNMEYLKTIRKDVFTGVFYSATENFGAFAGCNVKMPQNSTEIQVPALGMDIRCFDSAGNSIIGERGEIVMCSPTITFPIGLWKDENKSKLTSIYLSKFPGIWTQHDEGWINPETKGIMVVGRSDDTINQHGSRIGASDIYFAIHCIDELQDYICVSQRMCDGDCRAVLFVKMREGLKLTPEIKAKIEKNVDEVVWADCVPELILEIPDIPYNLNNKRMESVVRKIIEKNEIPEVMNIKNPECLEHFVNIPEVIEYNKPE